MERNINYLCLLLGAMIFGGSFYVSALRPPSVINLRAANRCDRRGLNDMGLTYQATCATNRVASRTYYRHSGRRRLWQRNNDDRWLDDDRDRTRNQRRVRTFTRTESSTTQSRRNSDVLDSSAKSALTQSKSKQSKTTRTTKKKSSPAPRRIRSSKPRRIRAKRGVIRMPRRRRGTVSGFRGGGPGAGK